MTHPGRFEWERALRDAEGVPWHVKSLLLMVATYMDGDGSNARPTTATLCRVTGLSRSRLFELLHGGEKAGWLRSVATPGKVSVRLPAIPDPSGQPDPSGPSDGSTGVRPAGPLRPTGPHPSDPPDGTRPTHRTHTKQDHSATTHQVQPSSPSAPRGAVAPREDTAQTIVREWIDRCARRPPSQVIGQVAKHIKAMLGEGIDPDDIRRGVAAWMAKGLHPSTLPSVVNERMNAGHLPPDELTPHQVDEILGPDRTSYPVPPREIEDGPPEQRRAWYAARTAERWPGRLAEAQRVLAAQRQNGGRRVEALR